uniref:Uncharacterized protein n=1 Tax=Tanacetum cinerariifolium TaxID=118510 RepID=A0A6L2NZW2_TANCI|nr:hypothetical protein [Tanacetum cinerariifolium]
MLLYYLLRYNLIGEILVGFQVQAFQLLTLIIYDNRSGVGRGRLAAASADHVFGPIFNRGGIKNSGGCDMPNMCGSAYGRGGNFTEEKLVNVDTVEVGSVVLTSLQI